MEDWTVPKYRSNSVYTSSYKRHRTVQYDSSRRKKKKKKKHFVQKCGTHQPSKAARGLSRETAKSKDQDSKERVERKTEKRQQAVIED